MRIRKQKHILFVVENNQIPMDTRVIKEAKALEEEGLEVSIICPNLKKEKKYHKKIDNIDVFQYFCFSEGKSFIGILSEYLIAIFCILSNSIKLYLRKPFHVVHLANPPDFLIFLFLPFKLFGLKIIFDHHDLSPELFTEKFGNNNLLFNLLLAFEKISYKLADVVITTNLSIKKTCIKRNKIPETKIHIVRNGPDLNEISSHKTKIDIKIDSRYLIGYVGNIDKQDSLEKLVNSVDYIINEKNFRDFRILIIGDGTDRVRIENKIKKKGLQNHFIFYGSEYNRKKMFSLLSKIDIGVEPSKESEKFSKSTSIKVMEYMAVGKPTVQYDTEEGKFTAKNASLFIQNNDEKAFGDAIISLLTDEKKRKNMGEYGKERIKELLQWRIQKEKLLKIYQNLTNS